jgi:CDP-glucose 4,6-dehydratase
VGERPSEVEDMVIDPQFWVGRRVFMTGHTGFKGAWASLLLSSLRANVYGLALAPGDDRSLFATARVEEDVDHRIGDVRELTTVVDAMTQARPDIVIHMAAQSLVRLSYAEPLATYAVNVMGTVNLLEAVRRVPSVKAVVVVTSDKCYDNVGWVWGYRETDDLGGHDPYSNSKACAELVTDAYRRSFFYGADAPRIASARAGNVIGGGDWARDRLVPDAMRAFLAGEDLRIRNPGSVRPWQHVLDPVVAYLVLAERLVQGPSGLSDAWNFGPSGPSEVPVERVVDRLVRLWGGSARWQHDGGDHPHEADYLKLDCSKAVSRLNWRPILDLERTLELTVEWYRAFGSGADIRPVTLSQIAEVLNAIGISVPAKRDQGWAGAHGCDRARVIGPATG